MKALFSRRMSSETDREKSVPGETLDWFPLEFGVGSMDASGTDRLLGQPEVEIVELLIRESAQNSWDAREPGGSPEFGLRCKVFTREAEQMLSRVVFAQGTRFTNLHESFARQTMGALEIWDRGTTGLNGPVRSDLAVPSGTPTNFIDLVFNVGTANKGAGTGGSFGFGKSSAFKASRAKTVVYWSVCATDTGNLEHRLIVSGLGRAFDHDGRRYTGRHWWGHIPEAAQEGERTRVEPLRGERARKIGEALFDRRFEPGETGTSMLVLDPDPATLLYNEESDLAVVTHGVLGGIHDRLRKLVVKNLWPKLLDVSGVPALRIFVGEEEMNAESLDLIPGMDGYRSALETVRKVQAVVGAAEPSISPGSHTKEIWCGSPRRLLGHLSVDVGPAPVAKDPSKEYAGQQVKVPVDAVCLMRNQAELVVKYLPVGEPIATQELCWTAVFKPIPAMDDAFARSETPAHDDWVPTSMTKSHAKTFVRVALREIRSEVRSLLKSYGETPVTVSEGSAAALSAELSDLGGFTAEPEVRRKGGTGGGGTKRGGVSRSVEIESIDLLGAEGAGRQRQRIGLTLTGKWGDRHRFMLSVRVATAEGGLDLETDEKVELHWGPAFAEGQQWIVSGSATAVVASGATGSRLPAYVDVVLPDDLSFAIGAETL